MSFTNLRADNLEEGSGYQHSVISLLTVDTTPSVSPISSKDKSDSFIEGIVSRGRCRIIQSNSSKNIFFRSTGVILNQSNINQNSVQCSLNIPYSYQVNPVGHCRHRQPEIFRERHIKIPVVQCDANFKTDTMYLNYR